MLSKLAAREQKVLKVFTKTINGLRKLASDAEKEQQNIDFNNAAYDEQITEIREKQGSLLGQRVILGEFRNRMDDKIKKLEEIGL